MWRGTWLAAGLANTDSEHLRSPSVPGMGSHSQTETSDPGSICPQLCACCCPADSGDVAQTHKCVCDFQRERDQDTVLNLPSASSCQSGPALGLVMGVTGLPRQLLVKGVNVQIHSQVNGPDLHVHSTDHDSPNGNEVIRPLKRPQTGQGPPGPPPQQSPCPPSAPAASHVVPAATGNLSSLSPDARKQLRLQDSQEAFSETLQRVPQPALIHPQVPEALLLLPVINETCVIRGNKEPRQGIV
ncbi:hypothetical protein E5288_WYG001764 [Bos mutus]|uniref:Uncharacterized protein n=1 Tax=Bos mutus TaxID=72004 RepID=A0A6B0RN10_9CETA|nr:hypothetical protein [Bos mutus]